MRTHVIERTSPKGPGQRFEGKCILCGLEDLPASAALEECGNPQGVSTESAIIAAILGDGD